MKLSRHITATSTALAVCYAFVLSVAAPPAAAQHMRVYKGTGIVTAVDAEDDIFAVDFTNANRALRHALGGDLASVYVSMDENTDFTINGDDSLDTSDLCEGDEVTVVIKTPERLSGHDLTDYPAAVVEAGDEEGECEE